MVHIFENLVSQVDHERIHNLYMSKKAQVTLDGKRAIVSGLGSKFPVVGVSGGGYGVEFCAATVERILNGDCKFKSQ